MGPMGSSLAGKTVMVVEDEYLIAMTIEMALSEVGAHVLGPFSTVDDGLAALDTNPLPDGAILDINVRRTPVFPLALALDARAVPFVFATGYDRWTVPESLSHIPRFEKPVDPAILANALGSMLAALEKTGTP